MYFPTPGTGSDGWPNDFAAACRAVALVLARKDPKTVAKAVELLVQAADRTEHGPT